MEEKNLELELKFKAPEEWNHPSPEKFTGYRHVYYIPKFFSFNDPKNNFYFRLSERQTGKTNCTFKSPISGFERTEIDGEEAFKKFNRTKKNIKEIGSLIFTCQISIINNIELTTKECKFGKFVELESLNNKHSKDELLKIANEQFGLTELENASFAEMLISANQKNSLL